MDSYMKLGVKVTLVLSLILGMVLYFIQPAFAIGLWIGSVVGLVNMAITSNYYADLLFQEDFSVLKYAIFFFAKLVLISGSMYLGIIYPQIINIFMVAVGLVMLKLSLYVIEFHIRRRKE